MKHNGGNMDYSILKVPTHVAIILDGNGRWAQARGMTRSQGHEHGFENLKKISQYVFDKGIQVLSVYAFSNARRYETVQPFVSALLPGKDKKEI